MPRIKGKPSWCKPSFDLYLAELPDPAIQGIYFHVPNPLAQDLPDDGLLGQP